MDRACSTDIMARRAAGACCGTGQQWATIDSGDGGNWRDMDRVSSIPAAAAAAGDVVAEAAAHNLLL